MKAEDGQIGNEKGEVCPMTADGRNGCENTANQSNEPNPDLGAPIYCAGQTFTPFEQMVEDLRLKRQRLYKAGAMEPATNVPQSHLPGANTNLLETLGLGEGDALDQCVLCAPLVGIEEEEN